MKKINLKSITVFICINLFLIFGLIAENPEVDSKTSEADKELSVEKKSAQKIVYTEKQEKMRIKASDIRLIPEKGDEYGGGGFHLYVKKNPGVRSILLTETVKDPAGKKDSYAYRAKEYNPINGDEIRYLNGEILKSEGAKYSLIDSTPQKSKTFGEFFHIYIPAKMVYGYSWTRNGEIEIGKGTFINIRSFEKPYADYSGEYMDSPFMFNLVVTPKKETVTLTDDYNPVANDKLLEISKDLTYSKGPETIIEDLKNIIKDFDKKNLDVVLTIDTTGSMKNDTDTLKKELLPMLNEEFKQLDNVRIGLCLFRDYNDNYHYKNLPVKIFGFTNNFNTVMKNLDSVRIIGNEGGDIPEATYEAIYASTAFFDWRNNVDKEIILITDAEPHPTPRKSRKYSKDYVMKIAADRGVKIRSILLPQD